MPDPNAQLQAGIFFAAVPHLRRLRALSVRHARRPRSGLRVRRGGSRAGGHQWAGADLLCGG
eukprot:9260851-Pyramimonas_sp.AAC.1